MEHHVQFVLAGSVAVQAWGVDVGTPGDLDIVPDLSRDNLRRLADGLRALEAESSPVTGRWVQSGADEYTWEQYPEDHPLFGTRIARPDPEDIATFDSLFKTRYGELDVVPYISGAYDALITGATHMTVHGVPDVPVASIEDLLACLTVPRRAEDADRVRALRTIQRHGRDTEARCS